LLGGGAAIVGQRSFALPPEAEKASFSFIQVTDTHISKSRLINERRGYDLPAEESIRRSRAVVKSINECGLPYDMVFHTGDVAETRDTGEDWDLAREIFDFKKEAWFVPGNHDVGYSNTVEYRPYFERRFGKCFQSMEPVKGLRLVTIDSQAIDPRAHTDDRIFVFEEMDRMLKPAMPTILLCHVTGLDSFHLNQVWKGWPESLMKLWTDHMKKGGVIAVLAGHFHRDEKHIVNGLPFHLCGPVINFWDRQSCYRHWTVENGQLTYRTVYLEI
jgi:3',5'-cyclic AMP phosphodiesterase CpdA